MPRFFVSVDGQVVGPIEGDDLQDYLAHPALSGRDVLVCGEGETEWAAPDVLTATRPGLAAADVDAEEDATVVGTLMLEPPPDDADGATVVASRAALPALSGSGVAPHRPGASDVSTALRGQVLQSVSPRDPRRGRGAPDVARSEPLRSGPPAPTVAPPFGPAPPSLRDDRAGAVPEVVGLAPVPVPPGPSPASRVRPKRVGARAVAAGLFVTVSLAAGTVFGFSAYRTHKAKQACDAAEAPTAEPACERACASGSDAHCLRGASLKAKRAPIDAERIARKHLPRPELRVEASLLLGTALIEQGKLDDADAAVAPVAEAATDAPAKARASQLLSEIRLARGEAAIREGKTEVAVSSLRSAHELRPSPATAGPLGRALAKLQRWDEAAPLLERATEAPTPAPPETYHLLAAAYQDAGKDDVSLKALRRGAAAHPDDYSLQKAVATKLTAAKKLADAQKAIEDFANRHPDHGESHEDAFNLMDPSKDAARRAAFLSNWHEKDPKNETACLLYASSGPSNKDDDKLAFLKQCATTVPAPDRIYEEVSGMLEKRGAKVAHAFFQEERERFPDRTSLVDLEAQLYLRERKKEDARNLIEKAIAEHPDDPVPTLAKVRFLEKTTKVEAASAVLEAAKERFSSRMDPFRFALGFHVRHKYWDRIDGELAALGRLGLPDQELTRLREITTFTRTDVSCVSVGQGPAVAGYDLAVPASSVSSHKGFWTGAAVQSGYIVNRCSAVMVDATVAVSFSIRQVAHVFIFAQVTTQTKGQTFNFRRLRPGEARPFSAGVALSALSLGSTPVGTLGGMGTYSEVASVSVTVRVLSPRLLGPVDGDVAGATSGRAARGRRLRTSVASVVQGDEGGRARPRLSTPARAAARGSGADLDASSARRGDGASPRAAGEGAPVGVAHSRSELHTRAL